MNEEKASPLDVVKGREPAFGPLLAVLVILLVLVVGASYLWSGWRGNNSSTATSTQVVIYMNSASVAPSATATSSNPTELDLIEQSLQNQNGTSSDYNFQ